MRFRVFASALLAVLCGTALYAQIPERVTFQPATFGHATHYGFYDARAGGSAKMTYANTNFAQRNYSRSGAVVRPYGLEPTKIVGYPQPDYRFQGYRVQRIGYVYTPVHPYDCLCANGGMIETTQISPRLTPDQGTGQSVGDEPVRAPIQRPNPEPVVAPQISTPKDTGISLTPPVRQQDLPRNVEVIVDKPEEKTPPTIGFGPVNNTDPFDFEDDDDDSDPFGPTLPGGAGGIGAGGTGGMSGAGMSGVTVPGPVNSFLDDDEDDLFGPPSPGPVNNTLDDDEDDPFGNSGGFGFPADEDDLFGPTIPDPANNNTNNRDDSDPFGPTIPGPANNNTIDKDDSDPFGDGGSFDINDLFDDDDFDNPF